MCPNRLDSHPEPSVTSPPNANATTLVDANAKLNALLNAAVDAIIIIDHLGKVELFNAAAEAMFGYLQSEVINKNVSMLMPKPYQDEHDQYLRHYIETGEAHIIGIGRKVQAIRKNGENFPIELSIGEVRESSHRQFIGIIRDISKQVQIEDEAQESRERLAHLTRLSTMGEMATGIAHEINQPLTAVATYAQACRRIVAKEKPDDTDKEQLLTTLDKISGQAIRAAEVIRHLRDFVKKRSSVREQVNLNKLVQETIDMAKTDSRLLKCGLILTLPEGSPITISADPVQIQQVLLNLIRNAVDAMADIKIKQAIAIQACWIDENTIQVSVIDNGHGVDKQTQSSLFTPFVTSKETGMGMGLAISQSLINSHGGSLLYRQRKTQGSVFYFTLPATSATLKETSESDA